MNIFVLDMNPVLAARYHNDKHASKMVLETAQMLSTCAKSIDADAPVYKPSYVNHPCTVWARTSQSNFNWLYSLGIALSEEFAFRYGKQHKSASVIRRCWYYSMDFPDVGLTPFAQAMPEEYKDPDPVKAYRNYYIYAKAHLADWNKGREKPEWYVKAN